jgi:RimJ/RimL family protein N-acetyltransferase
MAMTALRIEVLREEDLPFLLELWHVPEVMRYADEFPGLRGWTKDDEPQTAWLLYQEQRVQHGPAPTQLIVHLLGTEPEGKSAPITPIGESAVFPLPEGYTFRRWKKPEGVLAVMGDIKLLPQHWGCGLGTTAMRQVVDWVFRHTDVDIFAVPPHRLNPAAGRVYEKAGFRWFAGSLSYRGHRVMTLSREQFVQTEEKPG